MFDTLLIANRGEIACRIIRTAHALGLRTVAVYSDADADAPHVTLADAAVRIGPPPAVQSYLSIDALVDAARRSGAGAVHPGYGFLSENAAFAQACADAGLVFVGPPAGAIRAMGSKRHARRLMQQAGVRCVPGYDDPAQDDATLAAAAERIGFPLLIKASAGGGGRGMRIVADAAAFAAALRSARTEARNAFGSDELILEKIVEQARHVEVQVFGDMHGHRIHLGERDCSLQRRHQKVIEEAPAPGVDADLRAALGAAAVQAAAAVDYVGAGTVEFLLARDRSFYFLEMNTRLQVEHPVTECVTGLDLVEWQLRVARGEPLPLAQEQVVLRGHAFEARLYAEDPVRGFLPQTGRIARWRPAAGARIDAGVRDGQAITPHYDAMLAKVIACGATREDARRAVLRAVEDTVLFGVRSNQRFLADWLRHPRLADGTMTTGLIDAEPAPSEPRPAVHEIAVAAVLRCRRGGDGWSNAAGMASPLRLRCGEDTHAVTVQAPGGDSRGQDRSHTMRSPCGSGPGRDYSVRHHSGVVQLTLLDDDGEAATIAHDGVRRRYAYLHDRDTLWLHADGRALAFDDVTHAPQAVDRAGDGTVLHAPMDGTIVAVHVDVGATVVRGQPLLALEAMKMELPLQAASAGIVRRVHVARGDQVRGRQLLVELDTDGPHGTA